MFKFFYNVFIGFFFLVGTNCINPVNFFKGGAGTGGIYGKLEIEKFDKQRGRVETFPPTLATLSIAGTNLSVKPDSTGIFYFPEVEPGNYTVVARAPSITGTEFILSDVEVSPDSISISRYHVLKTSRSRFHIWDGTKIKRVDVRRTGSMVGKITDLNAGFRPLPDAHVFIRGTFWHAVSDSSGKYHIKGILLGVYMVFGQATPSYHVYRVYDVRIAPDTTSVVNFPLEPFGLPESPGKKKWVEKFIKQ